MVEKSKIARTVIKRASVLFFRKIIQFPKKNGQNGDLALLLDLKKLKLGVVKEPFSCSYFMFR
jgi:hypothetical protein